MNCDYCYRDKADVERVTLTLKIERDSAPRELERLVCNSCRGRYLSDKAKRT